MSCGCNQKIGKEFDPDSEGLSCTDLERFNNEDDPEEGRCQECGTDVYIDATICQSCGAAIMRTPSLSGKKPWITALAIISLAGFALTYVLF